MSSIEEITHNLSSVNYSLLLDALFEEIQKCDACIDTHRDGSLGFDADVLADNVAQRFATSSKFPFDNKGGTTYATVHTQELAQKEAFSEKIQGVKARLQALFLKKLGQRQPASYLSNLLTPIESFTKNTPIGLSYPLNQSQKIQKQKLHLRTSMQHSDPWLKAHKLTLQVKDIPTFDTQITQSICNYLEREGCESEEVEDTRTALEEMAQKPSELSSLRGAVVKQSVARIHREAKVRYLRYLLEGMKEWKKARTVPGATSEDISTVSDVGQCVTLLHNLILRLQGLDAYIRQEKERGYFQVSYQGTPVNYVDIFSREDAFDPLPIIPEVDGFLGESTDQLHGSKTFVSGMKMKLNGSVQVHGGSGQPVFDYNLGLLDANSAIYKAREASAKSLERFREKVLKVALLYCFVFIDPMNTSFRGGAYFEEHFLPALQSDDGEQQRKALYTLYKQLDTPEIRESVNVLRKVLSDFLRHKSIGPAKQQHSLVLSLNKRILQTDVDKIADNQIFFQETFERNGGKDVLKYVAIEDAHASNERVCSLPLSLTFEPIHYFAASNTPETFFMTYETQNVQMLPIFLAPIDSDRRAEIDRYAKTYAGIKRIAFYYRHRKDVRTDSARAFVYRFIYTLVSYAFLHMVAGYLPKTVARNIFFPIICIHVEKQVPDENNEKLNDDAFMHNFSKVLEHMLAEDYTASSQGFYLDTVDNKNNYQLKNALHSLYTALPRTFRRQPLPQTQIPPRQLQKLAIIVVSSRKCDYNTRTPDFYKASVLGEVIGIECLPDQAIRVSTLSTFSVTQDNKEMYTRSDAVLEQVRQCYAQGYSHFLYVARAPYSSTLHISDANEETELYFMNKSIIQGMRDVGKDIHVYPVFCDKYYAVNRKKNSHAPEYQVQSLYVDDIGELSDLSNDPSKKSLIFFNLFSGNTINKNAIYNGVMSYATLTNVYNDVTYEQYLWNDLLGKKDSFSLGSDILDYITLLHFSRNEKSNDSRFKLDPFVSIIGDESVGKVAIIPHMTGRASFNILAFLTEVRAVLRADK